MSADILLIEDNEQNRYLATYLLERAGHRVTACVDGPAALRAATERRWDLVLLDIQLPGMDGYVVAGSLRQLPELAGVPIVAVTSHAMAGDREKALQAGCDGYLEKPIDPYTFAAEIDRHLQR